MLVLDIVLSYLSLYKIYYQHKKTNIYNFCTWAKMLVFSGHAYFQFGVVQEVAMPSVFIKNEVVAVNAIAVTVVADVDAPAVAHAVVAVVAAVSDNVSVVADAA